jgi:hypothetical protein
MSDDDPNRIKPEALAALPVMAQKVLRDWVSAELQVVDYFSRLDVSWGQLRDDFLSNDIAASRPARTRLVSALPGLLAEVPAALDVLPVRRALDWLRATVAYDPDGRRKRERLILGRVAGAIKAPKWPRLRGKLATIEAVEREAGRLAEIGAIPPRRPAPGESRRDVWRDCLARAAGFHSGEAAERKLRRAVKRNG